MTILDLQILLEDMARLHGETAEVRLATQPSWPMEYKLAEHVAVDTEAKVVYLAQGDQLGYLSDVVSDELWSAGWPTS